MAPLHADGVNASRMAFPTRTSVSAQSGLQRSWPMKLATNSALRRAAGTNGAEAAEISAVPATLLGRLAVDRRHQGKGYGRFLLADALYRAAQSEIASFAVIVDAKEDDACRLYERESFLPLPDQPMNLFRPMVDIRRLFD